MKRIEIINGIYNSFSEDARLKKSRQGQLEYLISMNYIHRYLKQGDRVLEIGAGTGRYSITLSFGPMYHLYDAEDHHKAIDEAIRVTKSGGVIMTAFLSAHAIICTNYLYDRIPTVHGLKENFDSDYNVRHFKEQVFTGFDISEFEELFNDKEVYHITTVAVDNVLEIAEQRPDFSMTDEDFEAFANYQLNICEKREMLGNSSHLLHICRNR